MSVKLTVTVLFFLCAVAYSRTQTDLPDEDFTLPELPNPDPKATPVLLLPSQKPETEPVTEIKYPVEVEIDEQTEPGSSSTEIKTESTETAAPLTVVTFRPTNLHFLPQRPLLPFRHRHRCRHGHRMMKPRFYGNDMIVSGEKDVDFELGDHQERRGVDRQIPARWTRFHHGGHRFSFYDDVANGEEREWGSKKDHEHHHVEGEEKQEPEHEHGHEHGGHRFSFYDDVANGEEREWGPKRHHEHHHVEGEEEQEHGHEPEREHEHEHGHEHGGHRFSFYNDVANGEEREWGPKRHHEHHHVEGEEEQEHGHEPEREHEHEHGHEHGGHRFSFYDDVENGEEREWGPKRHHEHHHVEGEEEQEHGHEPEREHKHEHGHEHGGHRFSFYNDVANGEEREWGPKRHHEHHHVEGEEEQEHGHGHGHGHEHGHGHGHEHEHEHGHGHEWGLFRGIRKFVKHNF
ncbi:hypothetical protein DKX38_004650 [Salix brachista]|uniref:Uncharacterized protein n=1 Tax=Salix brachista TaxID=2182728 RepID=A0A5N5NE03_9ROSI|nr:hypothetical protein DKX38_004650 [Salix brachista]